MDRQSVPEAFSPRMVGKLREYECDALQRFAKSHIVCQEYPPKPYRAKCLHPLVAVLLIIPQDRFQASQVRRTPVFQDAGWFRGTDGTIPPA